MVVLLKICAISLASVSIISLIKIYKPELTVAVTLCSGIILLCFIINSIKDGIDIIYSFYEEMSYGQIYLPVILKTLGIAYVTEFAVALCDDAGEKSIGSKIELAGKIAIFFASIPVLTSLFDLLNNLV